MRAQSVFEFASNKMDKYYAPDWLVQFAIEKTFENIPIGEVTEIIEPAAGDGAFIPYLDKLGKPTKYYDLDPDDESIIQQQNFYKLDLPYKPGRLVITGPPYQGPSWILFAKKASKIAEWVAFISPHSFLDMKNPVPGLEIIKQYDLGWVTFRGSKTFGGVSKDIKTAFLIFKSIEPINQSRLIDQDFDIKQFDKKDTSQGYKYFISRQGYNTGNISISNKDFFSSIGIKIKNPKMEDPLLDFLESLKSMDLRKYSPTTKKTLNISRFRDMLEKELY